MGFQYIEVYTKINQLFVHNWIDLTYNSTSRKYIYFLKCKYY